MAVAQDLPDLENRAQYDAAQNSVVLDINGERLATLTNNEGRILSSRTRSRRASSRPWSRSRTSASTSTAASTSRASRRALYQDILSGSAQQGASTITQQFVKNALEAQDSRTIFQKLREAALAYQHRAPVVEGQDPHRVPELDLLRRGRLRDRGGGEDVLRLRASRAAASGSERDRARPSCCPGSRRCSPGSSPRPSAYSPRANPEDALARRNLVLTKMEEQGVHHLDASCRSTSSSRSRPAKDILPPQEDSEAPYFTSWLRQQLVDKYGAGQAFGGGLEVTSTLDLELQREVEEIVASRLAGIEPTASVVVLDNGTAQVRAMVGGPDYEKAPFNLATNGHRQPGLVVQAVHPRDRPLAGALARRGVRLRPAGDPLQGHVPEQERQDEEGPRAVRGQQLRRQLPRLRLAGHRHHLLGQLRLRPGRAPRSAHRTSPRPRRSWGSTPTSRPTASTRSRAAPTSRTTRR